MGEQADYIIDDRWRAMESDYDGPEPEDEGPRKATGQGPCPICSAPTVERTGKFGTFYGCSTFPKCKGSRNKGRV